MKPPKKTHGAPAQNPSKSRQKTRFKTGCDSSAGPAARWALASDGAFLLLGTNTEIPQPAARALVDFVRRLDGSEA